MGRITDPFAQALITQGVEYAVAEDKAFMAKSAHDEATAEGGLAATVRALATYLDEPEPIAAEAIMVATQEVLGG